MHKSVYRESPPRNVNWRDLLPITHRQRRRELTLPLPWLALSWATERRVIRSGHFDRTGPLHQVRLNRRLRYLM